MDISDIMPEGPGEYCDHSDPGGCWEGCPNPRPAKKRTVEDVRRELMTPELNAVLEYVRRTGKSAHPSTHYQHGDAVIYVSHRIGFDMDNLQAQVTAWSDALDSL